MIACSFCARALLIQKTEMHTTHKMAVSQGVMILADRMAYLFGAVEK
jgi:hypothetical protein